MKKVCSTIFLRLLFPFFLVCGSVFLWAGTASASYTIDVQQPTGGNTLNSTWHHAGNRFVPSQNNIVQLDLYAVNGGTQTIQFSICSGIPNNSSQADVDANIMTCNWPDNELVWTGTSTGSNLGTGFYRFVLPEAVGLTPSEDYYFAIDLDSGAVEHLDQNYDPTGSGLIVNQTQWGGHLNYKEYYDTEFNPEYCGDDICNNGETFGTCPQDCPPEEYIYIENLFFFYNPYLRNNQSTARIGYLYNEDIFTPYDYINIYERDTYNYWASTTFIGSSTVIDYNELGGQKQAGESYLSLTGTSTYTGFIIYDIVAHFASYWDAQTATTVPERESQPWELVVNWTSQQNIPLISWDFSTTTVLGDEFNTHEMACSAEEWASPDPVFGIDWLNATTSIHALNFPYLLCRYKEWILDVGIKPTQFIKNKISGLIGQIMNMFPFSLFKTIKDGWDDATDDLISLMTIKTAYATSSETFSTSTGIYTGSGDGYSFDIPNFLGTEGTTTIPIFSKTNFTNLLGDYGFNIYYFICRFLIWALVAVFFWDLITSRSHDELL